MCVQRRFSFEVEISSERKKKKRKKARSSKNPACFYDESFVEVSFSCGDLSQPLRIGWVGRGLQAAMMTTATVTTLEDALLGLKDNSLVSVKYELS